MLSQLSYLNATLLKQKNKKGVQVTIVNAGKDKDMDNLLYGLGLNFFSSIFELQCHKIRKPNRMRLSIRPCLTFLSH